MTQHLEATEDFETALGERLVGAGKLERAALDRAIRLRDSSGETIDQLLPKLGLVSERDVAQSIADTLGMPLVDAKSFPQDPVLEDKLSPRFLRESRILPLSVGDDGLVVAMANPTNTFAADALRLISGRAVVRRVGVPAEIDAAIDRLFGRGERVVEEVGSEGDEELEFDVERLKDLASEAPVIRLVNQLIAKAVEARASDVHIEPFENKLRVRYRIDGVLHEVDSPPARLQAAIISRIKIIAKLNIAERRLPQDGRVKLAIRGVPVDLRVATMPTLHGESVVMRILDSNRGKLDFGALGLSGADLKRYLSALERPNGVFLVTGPTGSGKTTTLYCSLLHFNSAERKILSVEDPIEYQLDGINQIQVKPNIGLDFANVLRSFLRHDPDIIMVGEIRDVETAEIAVQAALTGHLVLSTLHTNNAASSITRLLDMGVDDYLLTSTLNGIAAQRLVRTLCAHCRQPYEVMPELAAQLQLARYTNGESMRLYHPKGCAECNGTGYYGRTALVETLVMSDAIRQLILRHAAADELQRVATEEGMQPMFADGMRKAVVGLTTIEEVLRVTRES